MPSSRDVTHGDVKPSNILLSADGNPMLLDFNLARDGAPAVDDPGRAVDPGGTLAYMAPERLRALAVRRAGPARRPHRRNRTEAERDPDPSTATDRAAAPRRHLLAGHGLAGGALTGRPPSEAVTIPEARDPASRGRPC